MKIECFLNFLVSYGWEIQWVFVSNESKFNGSFLLRAFLIERYCVYVRNKTSSAIWIKLAGKTRCIRGIFLANVITFNLKISSDLSKYIHKILELFFINYSLVITSNHFLHFTCSKFFPQAGRQLDLDPWDNTNRQMFWCQLPYHWFELSYLLNLR